MKLSEAKINTILIDDEIILSSDLLSLYMKSVQSERNINKTKHTPIFFPTALVFQVLLFPGGLVRERVGEMCL